MEFQCHWSPIEVSVKEVFTPAAVAPLEDFSEVILLVIISDSSSDVVSEKEGTLIVDESKVVSRLFTRGFTAFTRSKYHFKRILRKSFHW